MTIQPAGAGWRRRRIKRWSLRVVAFAVFGLAAVCGVLSLVFLFSSCVLTGVTEVIAPGETRVTLPDSGTYTINYEYETVVNGRRFDTSQVIPSLRLELISTTSDAHIPIHESPHVEAKTPFSKSWSMAEFTVDRSGTYVLISQYPSGEREREEVVLAIARGDVATVWKSIFGLIGGIVLLFVGAWVRDLAG